jgi:4-hydroxy-3-methylbut-2-enyl diphosphate reductase
MVVIGGYNSSNTQALARMCAPRLTTFYIDSPQCVTDAGIRHRAIGANEETRATASQAVTHDGGQYLCVRDLAETELVCGFIRGTVAAADLMAHFKDAASAGFEPARDLQKIGLANQTTMLMSETLKVQETLRRAMIDRYGDAELDARFRAFDTICSATQERQDAVLEMLSAGGLDLMVVIGGYNSSNTQALARMCAPRVTTFYIDSPMCVDGTSIRHRAVGAAEETTTERWLPAGDIHIGITAGASTPDSVVGETIERILALRGRSAADLTQVDRIAESSSSFAKATADKQSYA